MDTLEKRIDHLSETIDEVKEEVAKLSEKSEQRFQGIETSFSELKAVIEKLVVSLKGDSLQSGDGLIPTVKDHSKRLTEVERLLVIYDVKKMWEEIEAFKKIKWQAKGAYFVLGAVGAFALKLVYDFLTK